MIKKTIAPSLFESLMHDTIIIFKVPQAGKSIRKIDLKYEFISFFQLQKFLIKSYQNKKVWVKI